MYISEFMKLEEELDKYRIVGAYGPEMKKKSKEGDTIWFELVKVKAGCESIEAVRLRWSGWYF